MMVLGWYNRSGDGELAQFPPSHKPLDLCSPFQLCMPSVLMCRRQGPSQVC